MSLIKSYRATPTLEGGGVTVNRVFGYNVVPDFDPFLLLDYLYDPYGEMSKGFPWHPHRGIETISYLINGNMTHEDSLGNIETISDGEVQWMVSGKGIMHQEMPSPSNKGFKGFQFWLNMPASKKLSSPQYLEAKKDKIGVYQTEGIKVRVISGNYQGVNGAINKDDLSVSLFHISLDKNSSIELNRDPNLNGYVFIFEGSGLLGDDLIEEVAAYTLAEGPFTIKTNNERLELIFAQGAPIKEPIAWGGPIVMNTKDELDEAFKQIRNGDFI